MTHHHHDHEIHFQRQGGLGHVLLDRPRALNALTLAQVRLMHPMLDDWAADPTVALVLVEGAGGRAFCAGGDIRALAEACRRGDVAQAAAFYREEYRLNRRIKTFPKPYVSILDGIVMGGGVGISAHGSHRVATERTLFAMPETGIGFFPDVGGSFLLSRCPGGSGMYLALSGARLGAADCLALGLVTHHVPSERIPALKEALAAEGDADAVLARFHVDPGPAPLAARRPLIDRCFAQPTVAAVLAALDAESDPWAAETAAVIRAKSPTALLVTFEQMRRGATLDFDACLRMEYRLAWRVAPAHDFLEGVRAVIVDKDNAPAWGPPDDSLLAAFDTPAPDGDLTF